MQIHVERAMGRLKQFRLIGGTIPLIGGTIPAQLNPLISPSVIVAAALYNLDIPLCR